MLQKKRIEEVNALRALAILLIISHHSFAIFQPKGWVVNFFVPQFAPYAYLSMLLRNVGLPLFIFLSGYIFQYQYVTNKKELLTGKFLLNKLQRLLVPAIIFGILYMVILGNIREDIKNIPLLIYKLLNGTDHLWFLPMLFWCFVFICLLKSLYNKPVYILAISFIMVPFSLFLPEDWSIAKALYHFSYFALGFYVMANKPYLQALLKNKLILLLILILFLSFFSMYFKLVYFNHSGGMVDKLLNNGCHFIANILGTTLVYLITIKIVHSQWQLNSILLQISIASFGMYLIQEFILKLLLQNSVFYNHINIWMVPFVLFLITVPLSFFLTKILLKINLFKKIIG